MPITGPQATERFTDRRQIQHISGNWTIQRGFDVINYLSDDDACNAFGIPRLGDTHPLNPDLTCVDVSASDDKLSLCKVTARYEVSPKTNNPTNTLIRLPVITWKWIKNSEPFDIDWNGNPTVNSAACAFRSNLNRNYSYRQLTITRYEPYYDSEQADYFTDTVNNSSITFQGQTFDPGQVYFVSYAPTQPYQVGETYVEVAYVFEIRTPQIRSGVLLTPLQIRHPFQARVLDQGLQGLFAKTDGSISVADIQTATAMPITHDVLLNGRGVPADATGFILQAGLTPLAAPANETFGNIAAAGVIEFGTPGKILIDQVPITFTVGGQSKTITNTFLIFQKYAEVDFSTVGHNINGGEA